MWPPLYVTTTQYSKMKFIPITLKTVVTLIRYDHYSRCGVYPSKYGMHTYTDKRWTKELGKYLVYLKH